jgi:hypothetical protein
VEVLQRVVRPFVILMGFLSSLVGTLGSFLIIERINVTIRALVDQKNGAGQEIEKLGALAGDYFMANQQGDLIYMLALQPGARQDLAGLIYKGNLLDLAEPVRNIIGALALAAPADVPDHFLVGGRLPAAAVEPVRARRRPRPPGGKGGGCGPD